MKTYSIHDGAQLTLDIGSEATIGSRLGGRTYRYPSHLSLGLVRSERHKRLLPSSTRSGLQQKCPLTRGNQEASQKVTAIHLDTIRRQLERRLEVAKASQKDSLVTLLEQEFQQLDCLSRVSSS